MNEILGIKNKLIKDIEDLISASSLKKRVITIEYQKAYQRWIDELGYVLKGKYRVFTIDKIIGAKEVSDTGKSHISKILHAFASIFAFIVGLLGNNIPAAVFLSGAYTLLDAARELFDLELRKSDLKTIRGKLGMWNYSQKRQRRIKNIIYM